MDNNYFIYKYEISIGNTILVTGEGQSFSNRRKSIYHWIMSELIQARYHLGNSVVTTALTGMAKVTASNPGIDTFLSVGVKFKQL